MKKENKKVGEGTPYHGKGESSSGSIPGINNPEIELPAFNPPVPNRAWTAMKAGYDIEELSEDEKREMYLGRDELF